MSPFSTFFSKSLLFLLKSEIESVKRFKLFDKLTHKRQLPNPDLASAKTKLSLVGYIIALPNPDLASAKTKLSVVGYIIALPNPDLPSAKTKLSLVGYIIAVKK